MTKTTEQIIQEIDRLEKLFFDRLKEEEKLYGMDNKLTVHTRTKWATIFDIKEWIEE